MNFDILCIFKFPNLCHSHITWRVKTFLLNSPTKKLAICKMKNFRIVVLDNFKGDGSLLAILFIIKFIFHFQMNAKKVREMGEPVLQTLSHLQRSGPASDDLFLSVKLFGIRLLKFLETCSTRHRDLVTGSTLTNKFDSFYFT